MATLAGAIPAQAAKPQPAPSNTVVTNNNDSGAGSLRQALLDVPTGGTITFASGVTGTITLTSGQLVVGKNMTIKGPGAGVLAVSGNNVTRVLVVNGGVTATISGLTIRDGNGSFDDGGGMFNGGTLTVTNSTLSGNSTNFGDGGGIFNEGTLTVTNSTLSGNSTIGEGGGIENRGTLTVANTTLSNNSAFQGGGLTNVTGTMTVTNSTLSNNSVDDTNGAGGGILNFINGTLTVTNSTLSGNSAAIGGGIFNSATLTVTNSTLSGNSAQTGGGIFNGGGTISVLGSTFSGNSGSGDGGAIRNDGSATVVNSTFEGNTAGNTAGGINNPFGTLKITNSTFSGNNATNSGGAPGGINVQTGTVAMNNSILASSQGGNCSGTISGSNNISFPATDASCSGFSSGDPKLGPLQDNGGPTKTMAIPADSAAIDAGNSNACNAPAPPPVANTGAGGKDQRGASRGIDGNADGSGGCDIGAFELNDADLAVTVSAPSTVTSGSTMTYTITLLNNGPLDDPAVVLKNTIPGGTKFLSYTATQGTCTPEGKGSVTVNCTIGPMAAHTGQGATITIKVSASTRGNLVNVARISGSRFDPSESNNTAVTNTNASK